MVVHELHGDVAIGQELDVVVEFARGDGAGAGLLDLRRATGAQRLVEVGGGDGERAVCGFEEKVREDGDGRLALDDGLRGGELAEQLGARDGDLQVACGGFGGGGSGHGVGSPFFGAGFFGEGCGGHGVTPLEAAHGAARRPMDVLPDSRACEGFRARVEACEFQGVSCAMRGGVATVCVEGFSSAARMLLRNHSERVEIDRSSTRCAWKSG